MAYPNPIAEMTNEVYQLQYQNDYIVKNTLLANGLNFFRNLSTQGLMSREAPKGKGRVWYIDDSNRTAQFALGTDRSMTKFSTKEQDGVQLIMSYSELFTRTNISGQEFRTAQSDPGNADEFINAFQKIADDTIDAFSHVLPTVLLDDGTGTLAKYAGAGETVNANATGASILVDDRRSFYKDQIIEVYASNGTSKGIVRVANTGDSYGAGAIEIDNDLDGAVNITFATDDYVAIAGSQYLQSCGFRYIIDNGVDDNSGAYNKYPRTPAGSSQFGVDRTSAIGSKSVRAQVIDNGSNTFGYTTLDKAVLKLNIFGKQADVMVREDQAVPMFQYQIICGVEQMMAIQQENRATGRSYDLVSVDGREDNGLRLPSYSGLPFRMFRQMPKNIAYIPNLGKFETSFREPQMISNPDSGPFQRQFGNDQYEHVRSLRFHMLGTDLTSSVKIINAPGYEG